jgi:YD repeat-containing protein
MKLFRNLNLLGASILAVSAAALGLAQSASANVSLRNGNFFVGYTDIVYPGGFEPKIERIYNSKTEFATGIFGPGWGFEYEVYLTVEADGSVVIHEFGGGADNRFTPTSFNEGELNQAVDQIANAAKSVGAIGSADQLEKYKKNLKADASFRNDEWEKYRRIGKLQARTLSDKTQLHSNRFSYQYVTKVPGGYVRTSENGHTEKFNDTGKLVHVSDRNGNFIDLSYNGENKLERIVDNSNRRMRFHYNPMGRVEMIEGENGQKATYEYNGSGMLTKSHDVNNNVYTFKYDRAPVYQPVPVVPNMIEIGYSDKTTMQMSYYPVKQLESVKTVKERDGTLTEYTYTRDNGDKGHFSVAVSVKGADGKKISMSKYEYFMKRKADGDEWQYKMVTTIDDDRTETTYNECCGLPLIIKHNGEETSFEYDVKGHVTKKITPSEITDLTYDQKVGKVSRVVRYSKTDKRQATWSEFQYDPKGNLIFAKNSEKRGVRLFYDQNGRIRSMVDQSHRRIDFKYNENSKPVEISDPSLGTITVSYYNSGEIKKVESTAGRKIALQVTSAFQNLLDIIRPAGVTLSF